MIAELTDTTGIAEISAGYELISSFRVQDLKQVLDNIKPGIEEVRVAFFPYRKNSKKAGAALLLKSRGSNQPQWIYVSPMRGKNQGPVSILDILAPIPEVLHSKFLKDEVNEVLKAAESFKSTKDIVNRGELVTEMSTNPSRYPVLSSRTITRMKQSVSFAMNQNYRRVNGIQAHNPAWKINQQKSIQEVPV